MCIIDEAQLQNLEYKQVVCLFFKCPQASCLYKYGMTLMG